VSTAVRVQNLLDFRSVHDERYARRGALLLPTPARKQGLVVAAAVTVVVLVGVGSSGMVVRARMVGWHPSVNFLLSAGCPASLLDAQRSVGGEVGLRGELTGKIAAGGALLLPHRKMS